MTADQLNLLGEPDLPDDSELGPVQRECMRELRRLGTLHREEAGAIAHEHRGKHSRDERCAYCATDGAQLVASLVNRNVAVRAPEGAVQLPRPTVNPPDDEIPY